MAQHVYHVLVRFTTLEPIPEEEEGDLGIADAVTECVEEVLDPDDVNRAEVLDFRTEAEWKLVRDL
jgi:hypothetical protein